MQLGNSNSKLAERQSMPKWQGMEISEMDGPSPLRSAGLKTWIGVCNNPRTGADVEDDVAVDTYT
eukprot:4478933-Pyramimonas_sp.AAC.1